jgi:hypothetical protein
MEGYCILYADYFADNLLHGEAVFRHRLRMSDAAWCVDVNYRPVGNPKRKV